MILRTPSSPHQHAPATVTQVMLAVVYALVPGLLAYVYFFGWGVAVNITLAVAVALIAEGIILKLRAKPVKPFLTDGSVVVTAVLLGMALPPLAPWWVTTLGTAFAVVFAKHLYGGLGFNPFNPAMVGYAMLLVSFPREMTTWLPPFALDSSAHSFVDALRAIFTGDLPPGKTLDTISMATPLDWLRTEVGQGETVTDATSASPLFGILGGKGWEWVNGSILLGGLWLMYRNIISWHIPAGLLGMLGVMALGFHLYDPSHYASPLFHLFSGAAMLGAFFIATDPVSASTTPRGRLIYGAGIGALTYIIRTWGGYPDAIAFAVLLMNMVVPTLDHYTQPRVYGHKRKP